MQAAIEGEAHSISVDYSNLGYPTNIYIDRIKLAIDDEVRYTVSAFEQIR